MNDQDVRPSTRIELALALHCHPAQVIAFEAAGMPCKGADGRYDLALIREWLKEQRLEAGVLLTR